MSYDLSLFSDAVRDESTGHQKRTYTGIGTSAPDPRKEALKQRIASALIDCDSKLQLFHFDHELLAQKHGLSLEEAMRRYRHLELNDSPPPEGEGLQIILFDDELSVSVPFWHQGQRARDVFARVWKYLKIMHTETGFPVYDTQFGRILDLTKDFEGVVSFYMHCVDQTQGTIAASRKPKTHPWWKFWQA